MNLSIRITRSGNFIKHFHNFKPANATQNFQNKSSDLSFVKENNFYSTIRNLHKQTVMLVLLDLMLRNLMLEIFKN